MKNLILFSLLAAAGCASSPQPQVREIYEPVPVPVSRSRVTEPLQQPTSIETFVYDQKPLPGQPLLVAPDQAQSVIDKFKEAYGKLGQPRLLLYVNRELVDEKSGLKLVARTEKTESTRRKVDSTVDANGRGSNSVNINAGGNVTVNGSDVDNLSNGSSSSERVSNENRYRLQERDNKLADRQTVRDVERLFGRPLRAAGASLADQSVATQLMGDKPLRSFTANTEGETARKDRLALLKIADVVIEVLISSRNISVSDVSGGKSYTVPDIQATAISLEDSKILGQASSRDVLGKDRYAGHIARNYDVQDIAEATALALMEDMVGR
ncbi:MAG: hypothetical protein ABIR24_02600 [Verrucomicrobiota bacterium]